MNRFFYFFLLLAVSFKGYSQDKPFFVGNGTDTTSYAKNTNVQFIEFYNSASPQLRDQFFYRISDIAEIDSITNNIFRCSLKDDQSVRAFKDIADTCACIRSTSAEYVYQEMSSWTTREVLLKLDSANNIGEFLKIQILP